MVNLGHVVGNGISDISYSLNSGGNTVVTVTLDNGSTEEFIVNKGSQGTQGEQGVQGEPGVGVSEVVLVETAGMVKTYHMCFTDGNYFEFQVKDGEGSENTPVDTVEDGNMKPVTSNAVYEYIEEYIGAYEEDMSS